MNLNIIHPLASFWHSSKRIFIVSTKPDWFEYKTMIKITALGIAVISVIDYVITLLFRLLAIGGI